MKLRGMGRATDVAFIRRVIAGLCVAGALTACGDDEPGAVATTTSTSPAVQCSADSLAPGLDPTDAPEPVATTRAAIVDAAVACDYDALGRLAAAGAQRFTYSFGDSDNAAEYWRDEEARGEQPLAVLVKLLRLAHAERGTGDESQFVWPVAYSFDTWADVPAEHVEPLRAIYTPAQLEQFRATNAYLGHRVGIAPSGEWLFFVAGD